MAEEPLAVTLYDLAGAEADRRFSPFCWRTKMALAHKGLDVETVDGTAIRAPGKPPWAGGPWAVGSTHPGWKPWMADGKPGNGNGRAGAPGQSKDKASDDEPEPSESPGS